MSRPRPSTSSAYDYDDYDRPTSAPSNRPSPPALAGGGAPYEIIHADVNSRETPHIIKFALSFGDGDETRFPPEDADIKRLDDQHSKSQLWRRTAGEWLAKDLDLFDDSEKFWALDNLPTGYGLFEQITHPKMDVPKRGVMRRDRFIFGHAGRKLRSALSLGKHISWLIHGSIDTCTCDGCKSTSKAQRVPRNVKDDTKRKSKGKGRATLWGGGSDDDDGEDGDEVEDSFLSEREEGVDYDEESEMSHASPKKRPKLSTTGAGRQQPMSEALRNAFKQVDTFPLPPRHEFFAMTPLKADAMDELKLKASQKEDVENPELSRVGELVWAEVDVPQGRSSVTHWPGIVKRRELVEGGGEVSADYVVDLLGLDSTVQVVGMGVVPWLSFEEPNARDIVDEGDDTQVAAAVERKWTLETLRSEGEAVVGALFLFAVQIGNWMSTMQIRSVPTIHAGLHLIANPNPPARARGLATLIPSTGSARYLSHAWIGYGPETLWAGDYVRLTSTAELPYFVKPQMSLPSKSSLPTSLILRVNKIIRGGTGSPLLARGRLYELDEIPAAGVPGPKAPTTPQDAYGLPPPFPGHLWRFLASSADILMSDVAGRYYPLPVDVREREESIDEIVDQARQSGTVGEIGVGARSLLLAGLLIKGWTPAIEATNGISGGREEMLAVSEEMATKDFKAWGKVLAENSRRAKSRGSDLPSRAAKGKGRARLANLIEDDSDLDMEM